MGSKPKKWEELFFSEDNSVKANAFDKIAEQYYDGNFGTMMKSDFETLLFHLYIERILEKDESNFSAYSDFRLSKELGISQSKVSNLKIRKQLQYPREFKWREAFSKVSSNARYENGKIKIQIPDINLYYEIKNAIEEEGGFVDLTLTPKLLQVSPEYFLDLLVAVEEDEKRDKLRKKLREEIREKNKDVEFLESESLGKQLTDAGIDIVVGVIQKIVPISSENLKKFANNVVAELKLHLKKPSDRKA